MIAALFDIFHVVGLCELRESVDRSAVQILGKAKMISRNHVLCGILLILISAILSEGAISTVFAASLPDFPTTQHQLPATETPFSRLSPGWESGITTISYLLGLFLAGIAIHHFRSRRLIFILSLISVVVLGFIIKGCVCPVGSLQNIVAAIFVENYTVSLGVILLFLFPIWVSLFYGRVFCSCVCPLGSLQEIVAIKPQRIPLWLEHSLGLFRYFYLGLAVVFASTGLWFIVCRFDPFVGFFRYSGEFYVLSFGAVLLLIGIFIARPYCRFFCPYGAILGLCSKFSSKNITVSPGDCINCRLCEEICPYEAILKPTVPPDAQEKKQGPLRLIAVFLAGPLIIVFFGFIGHNSAMQIAREHKDIRLAELLRAEETGLVPDRGTFRETRAFHKTQDESEYLYQRAAKAYSRIRTANTLFGIWVGVVISAKMISFTTRRRRTEYEVDASRCVACGRCFWYCPNQKENRVFLEPESPQNP